MLRIGVHIMTHLRRYMVRDVDSVGRILLRMHLASVLIMGDIIVLRGAGSAM